MAIQRDKRKTPPRGRTRGAARSAGKRDLISIADLSGADVSEIFTLASEIKLEFQARCRPPLLGGKTLAMIFQKPSLRTRVTFETGMTQLGGSAIYLAPDDIRAGERESVADIAHNLARWVDVIVARTYAHELLLELAQAADIPVINGLTDLLHPCQVLTDCFTVQELRGGLTDCRVTFVGDGNNVAHSWLHAAACLGFNLTIACPPGYEPDASVTRWAADRAADRIVVTHDPRDAVRHADVIYTDVWASMGQESDIDTRRRTFRRYQVNESLVRLAAPDAVVMHCLPAHRGEEITDAVLDGPHSIVLEQAENRLHTQKGILVWLLAAADSQRSASEPAAVRRRRAGSARTQPRKTRKVSRR